MVQDRAILMEADWSEFGSHIWSIERFSTTVNWPLTQISTARHYSTLNISETIQERHGLTVTTDH